MNQQEALIVVMGATGSGKSTFINKASGSDLEVGYGLHSCTREIQFGREFDMDGRVITLLDTPGFDDTNLSDTDVLRTIATFLSSAYEYGKKVTGIIFLHRISDNRVGGTSMRNFKMFRELCGTKALQNVILVTNMWGEIDEGVGDAREEELMTSSIFFQPLLQRGATIMRHDASKAQESARNIIKCLLNKAPVALRIQREIVENSLQLCETAAGRELGRDLAELERKHREEMAELVGQMNDAIRRKDGQMREEIEMQRAELQVLLEKTESDALKLRSDSHKESERLKRLIADAEKDSREAATKMAAAYEEKVSELESKMRSGAAASKTEQARLQTQLELLQRDHEVVRRGNRGSPIFQTILKVMLTCAVSAVAPHVAHHVGPAVTAVFRGAHH